MVFADLFFIYVFLPLCLICYGLAKKLSTKNIVLIVFSLIFYAWGEPLWISLLLFSSFFNWFIGILIGKFRDTPRAKLAVGGGIFVDILLLLIFKYSAFIVENLNAVSGAAIPVPQITLPIGISFYTFQAISYILDCYWETVDVQPKYHKFLLYLSLFPQLIAGPIVRYSVVEQEIDNRSVNATDLCEGALRVILGLAKKVILANNIARIAETIYAGDSAVYGTALYWLAAVAYALQIYFDFSGYSDMAIGLGRMFGFHFLENFDHPYTALSITDFWRRWHISLSTWFRDYVYIPLGGNRVKKSRWIRNLLVVWALTGFWHGAQWNFLFWGLYYGLLLLAEKLFLGRLLERLPRAVRWLYTAFFVLIGWVLFNLTDFPSLCHALKLMFVPQATDWVAAAATNVSLLKAVVYLPLGIVCCLPLLRREPKSTKGILLADLASGLLLIVCIVFILSSSYNPFIYFRF